MLTAIGRGDERVGRAFAAAGLDREVPFEAADFTAVINLVRGGLGIAFLPTTVAADLGADLDVIEISDYTFTWVISVATPAGRRISAAARAILAELPEPAPQPNGAGPAGLGIAAADSR